MAGRTGRRGDGMEVGAFADPLDAASVAMGAIFALIGAAFAFLAIPPAAKALIGRVVARGGADVAASAGAVSPRVRAACAAALGIACGWAAWSVCSSGSMPMPFDLLVAACWIAVWASLIAATACDVAARVIPRESCWVIAAAGAALQAASAGARALAAGAACGCACAGFCLLANRLAQRLGRGRMVGGGDARCMAALSIASGFGALEGFAVCFSAAAVVAAGGTLLGRLRRGAAVPLAPFFCLWAVFGVGGALMP